MGPLRETTLPSMNIKLALLVCAAVVGTAAGLTCNVYSRTSQTSDTASAASSVTTCSTGQDSCLSFTYTTQGSNNFAAGMCYATSGGCPGIQTAMEGAATANSLTMSNWACTECTTDACNAINTPSTSSVGRTASLSVAALVVAVLGYRSA